ncbi:MAG: thiamine pyrophosphate-dependent enzyme [Candidatus Palauibacterales bacterium]|nr:thiamine pyrophosphate-dependent enzyme [Candidatus Palauibacterales bacterium]
MRTQGCSLLRRAQDQDRVLEMDDYEGPQARWCPGCGDHSILAATERLLKNEQIAPEETVVVSGIGCSGRFPHHIDTYGFHAIHGRALPVATGVKLHRPDLNVFAVMGDGDCISIGAGHWIHATRYNADMVAMMFDNHIYGLTKKQTSPTTPQGYATNTQPHGTYLPPMNPLTATLGVSNVSFVAQTAEWVPQHLNATLEAAHHHEGFSFVRILQRCPHYTSEMFLDAVRDPDRIELLVHPDGVEAGGGLSEIYEHRRRHDPSDLDFARRLAEKEGTDAERIRLGVYYRDESRPVYDRIRSVPRRSAEERVQTLEEELDRHAV